MIFLTVVREFRVHIIIYYFIIFIYFIILLYYLFMITSKVIRNLSKFLKTKCVIKISN